MDDLLGIDAFRKQVAEDRLPDIDTVFHLGACSSTTETNEAYMMDNNTAYTRELCEWCLRHDVRFIYASSAATYGDGSRGYDDDDSITPSLEPLNLYGVSKQDMDLWALRNGHLDRVVGLKYFNVFGPHENHKGYMRSVINKAYLQIQDHGDLALFRSEHPDYEDGKQLRDFVYVKDAVNVTLFFHDHRDVSGLFNCGTGIARTWLDLGHAVFAAMDREPDIRFIDLPAELKGKYQYFTQAATDKLRAAGYTAAFTPLEDAVADYLRGYLSRHRPSA
jgi:ADP-L-glycero-D-manno-heptose 6-epimerase